MFPELWNAEWKTGRWKNGDGQRAKGKESEGRKANDAWREVKKEVGERGKKMDSGEWRTMVDCA